MVMVSGVALRVAGLYRDDAWICFSRFVYLD
jgi:hypothetical protein